MLVSDVITQITNMYSMKANLHTPQFGLSISNILLDVDNCIKDVRKIREDDQIKRWLQV